SINVNTRDFTWRTDLNFSTNRPRIEKLITNEDMLNKLLFIGKPWNIYYDNVVAGIWQVDEAAEAAGFATFPGFTRLMDISGPEGKPDGSVSDVYDRIIHGQRDPKWSLYMRNTWRIKRVSIGMALNGNFGHVI